jgi:hypothetical protein
LAGVLGTASHKGGIIVGAGIEYVLGGIAEAALGLELAVVQFVEGCVAQVFRGTVAVVRFAGIESAAADELDWFVLADIE